MGTNKILSNGGNMRNIDDCSANRDIFDPADASSSKEEEHEVALLHENIHWANRRIDTLPDFQRWLVLEDLNRDSDFTSTTDQPLVLFHNLTASLEEPTSDNQIAFAPTGRLLYQSQSNLADQGRTDLEAGRHATQVPVAAIQTIDGGQRSVRLLSDPKGLLCSKENSNSPHRRSDNRRTVIILFGTEHIGGIKQTHEAFDLIIRSTAAEIREEGLDHKYSPYNQRTGKEPPLKGRFNGRRSWASKRAAASVFFLNSLTEVATDWEQGNDITLKGQS
ncbi:hypothetical protein BLNAU_22692 [Blattamonas nauphoetae]|uniref:Uncharacterized protein n=1 Tax=Blattamonas nauphoetae TaxID=2049346 RepID=A0ABQ9WSC5_9EUKA|nr:hypothetical protein BLNAU_22692 [Blattamonas nauphoetae]